MSCTSSTNETTFTTRFHDPAYLTAEQYAPQTFVGNISPDGQAVGALFDRLMAELSVGGADSATTTSILRIPVTVTDPLTENFLGYYVALRGVVAKTAGTRAVLFVELGGATKTIEYPYGMTTNESFQANIFSFSFFDNIQENQGDGTGSSSGFPPHLTAVVVLAVQRRGASDSVMIVVDSLDVEMEKLAKLPVGAGTEGSDPKCEKAGKV